MMRTSLLNLGILLTVLSGLITRKALNPLTPDDVPVEESNLMMISNKLIKTTKKSRQFHPLLKYEFLCIHKPYDMILIIASTKKQKVVILSMKNNF